MPTSMILALPDDIAWYLEDCAERRGVSPAALVIGFLRAQIAHEASATMPLTDDHPPLEDTLHPPQELTTVILPNEAGRAAGRVSVPVVALGKPHPSSRRRPRRMRRSARRQRNSRHRRRSMYLHHVHDDPSGACSPEERWQRLIYAGSPEDARLIAAVNYDGEGPVTAIPWEDFFCVMVLQGFPQRSWAGIEDNPEVQRLAGWGCDDELPCTYCGLWPNGLPQYAICPECDMCRECGCDPECPSPKEEERTHTQL